MTSRTLFLASLALAIVWTSYLTLHADTPSTATDSGSEATQPANKTPPAHSPAEADKATFPSADSFAMSSTHTDDQPQDTAPASLSPIDRIRAIQDKTALHQSLLKDHAEHHRYPAHNRRFNSTAADPVLRHYGMDQRVTMSDDGQYALSVASDQKYYLPSQEVTLLARLQDAHGKALAGNFAGQLIHNEHRNLGFLSFEDADQDGRYESRFSLARFEGQALPPGLYKVLIVEQNSDLVDAVAFVVSEPVIQATGEFRDALTPQGHLRIEVEVHVQARHRFYAQASLYGQADTPIGTTQFSDTLAPGKHWIPLDFYGLMVRDSGESGPYYLKHLSLAKVGVPMERMPLHTLAYQTQSYGLDQFAEGPFSEVLN